MKTISRVVSLLTLVCLLASLFTGCGETAPATEPTEAPTQGVEATVGSTEPLEIIDYATAVKLDMGSPTAKQEVTVKTLVDGDTTHFYVPSSVMPGGVLKARYLAINTPESTGKIEEWGKKASNFTREKLSNASSIIIESDTGTWNADSTGDRYLCWVWYKPAGESEYRNLNLEILQNGLAIASNSSQNRYGEYAVAAIAQARAQKLNVHSGEKDPDFFYGDAYEVTLKELRTNIEAYNGLKVAFNGVITVNDNNSVYVESYDAETDMYYGMAVYYGFGLSGAGLEILNVGNEVRIVGSVQYYEAGGTWQVSDVNYRAMKPDDPGNIQKLSEGNAPAYRLTDAETFNKATVTIVGEEGDQEFPYSQLAMSTSVEMKGLKVVDVYTTKNEESASKGAMTLTCKVGNQYISVRTVVLYDENGNLVTEDAYMGKTIDVKGIVDFFSDSYQIKVYSTNSITVH
jgi:endonuclease YncB( thermonuclease family)